MCAVLRRDLSLDEVKHVLVKMPSNIIPNFENPLLLADFLIVILWSLMVVGLLLV